MTQPEDEVVRAADDGEQRVPAQRSTPPGTVVGRSAVRDALAARLGVPPEVAGLVARGNAEAIRQALAEMAARATKGLGDGPDEFVRDDEVDDA